MGQSSRFELACLQCLAVRAIQLEWIPDLTATQFAGCLRQFVSRCGKTELIISDDVPQFKQASTVLNNQDDQDIAMTM